MADKNLSITVNQIKLLLSKPLPGFDAQRRMIPDGRDNFPPSNSSTIKHSAVLMLLFEENNQLFFCLTKRNQQLKHHPGQISFPGGRCEKYEIDPVYTALRETEEEIGISRYKIAILGQLSEVYVSVSNFIIYPYIGYIDSKPNFMVNHEEVDSLIILPLDSIFEQQNHTKIIVNTSLGEMEVPCYLIQDQIIWGATSMMIAELEEILKRHYSHRAAR